jgi:recombination protein RecT
MATEPTALTQADAGAVTTATRNTVVDYFQTEEMRAKVAAALPKHMTPDRMIRVALTAFMRTPKLLECTKASLVKCLLDCSAMGLEPDGRRAHLIPYGKVCTLILDYKGIVELVRRSGDVSFIHCDVVYEHDDFSYSFGSGAHLRHTPNLEDRGTKVKAVYSFVRLQDGSEDFIVLSPQDIEKVRKASRAANDGPWVQWWDEMAKKTAFRRHSKWLPLSYETRDAIERDDELPPEPATRERAVITLDSLTPSADENRGHDHTEPEKHAAPTIAEVREAQKAVAKDKAAETKLVPSHVKALAAQADKMDLALFWRVLGDRGYGNLDDVPAEEADAILKALKEAAVPVGSF